jgi:hypothetical protein
VGMLCADHATPSMRKSLALTSPTSGGCSVGIVCLRTKGHEVFFLYMEDQVIIAKSDDGLQTNVNEP